MVEADMLGGTRWGLSWSIVVVRDLFMSQEVKRDLMSKEMW